MKLNKNTTALSLGSLFGLMHLLWVIVIALGLGQSLADWWHRVHFIENTQVITDFNIVIAIIGVIGAFVCGYIVGYVFSYLWNRLEKK